MKKLRQKAIDSALLAREFYNKPAVNFKSGGFIVMMCVAWTSFFHAWVLKKRIYPWYKRNNEKGKSELFTITLSTPDGKKIQGKKWWDLNNCIQEFFKKNPDLPLQRNLEFISSLRDMVIHREMPEIDASIFGECQACVMNFNDYLKKYLNVKQGLDQFLSFSIQLFKNLKNLMETSIKNLKNSDTAEVMKFIKTFRSSLSTDVFETQQ